MYVDTSKSIQKGKVYYRHLLRTSYREGGKVKHRTVANISDCSDAEIAAIKLALKHKDDLSVLGSRKEICSNQGLRVGVVLTLSAIARRIGLTAALGKDQQGRLALWQVMARLIDQGSRLSAVRLATSHAACDILGLEAFTEDTLYQNLAWLSERQEAIEQRLFRRRYGSAPPQLFLYDVTSTYLEGVENILAAFGYNRDGKRGKMQLVIGLLTAPDGAPVAVRVFAGNTQDPKTVSEQVSILAESFGVREVTIVGDRGMLKGPQQKLLNGAGFHFITAITKPQIRGLIQRGLLQMGLFEETVCQAQIENGRYVLRRNPQRAQEVAASRADKLAKIRADVASLNQYLADHPRAKTETAQRSVAGVVAKLKVAGWVHVITSGREIALEMNDAAREREAELDGCYALHTDLTSDEIKAELIHDRYKDLVEVERAFRTCKQAHLEMRPVYVRCEASTRGHVFVVMLAYLLQRELESAWRSLDLKISEGLDELGALRSVEIIMPGATFQQIPNPTGRAKDLLTAAKVQLPPVIPNRKVTVATRKKLPPERKSK